MSYTARPPFTGGMSNQNQQQQQGGQSNNPNIGASGIPNMPIMNNAPSISGNHLANPSGSSPMSVIDQKIFQQQLLMQSQLMLQQTQQFQQQQTASQQQAKFQQQPNQALNRIMSGMMNDKNGSNVTPQTQLQQYAQLQALIQLQQAALQQKSFQQQSLPTNPAPVARQNIPAMQKQPANYPRANMPAKNLPPNSSPMQSRKSFPNAQKSAVPQVQSGMVSAPMNISGGSSRSTLPQIPSAMANSPKGYADILAASLSNSQASINITPSLTITKTSSPSSSSYAKSSTPNKPVSSNFTSPKSFLSEAISMSLGNVPISVKVSQPPSVSVTPANKPTISPTNKIFPPTPQKLTTLENVPGLQKLSPTSPRTKQTPRKNTNPVRTTSLSPATQTSSQSAVPPTDPKVTSSPAVAAAAAMKPPIPSSSVPNASKPQPVAVTPQTPPKANATASSVPVSPAANKPLQAKPTTPSNSSNASKPCVQPVKAGAVPPPARGVNEKDTKTVENKNVDKSNEKTDKAAEKTIVEQTKDTKSTSSAVNKTPASPANKQAESKAKQNTPSPNKNQSAVKDKIAPASTPSTPVEIKEKTPVAKTPRPAQASTSTPVANSAEAKVKRNRLKTIPYQSPTPEFELVSKISAIEAINAHRKKAEEDKLTLFYKNEFLAVRNADGGFFLCQATYNVYKSSPKIRIRWLSEDTNNKNIYCLDFYDKTDIECVLTTVSLNKLPKGKFELTQVERDRVENILKKALDVENGIVERPDVTEENPDGLDLSLYNDESQIEKKSPGKRKNDSAKATETPAKKTKINKNSSAKAKATKKSPVKTPVAAKDSDSAEAEKDIQSTPTIKRTVTKRKLADENEAQGTEDNSNKGSEASKEDEPSAKVSKTEAESPKQTSDKVAESPTAAVGSAAQSSRATRRSKN